MDTDSALKARRGCSPFDPSALEGFKALLVEQQAALERSLAGLEDSGLRTARESGGAGSSVPGHLAELASDSFEQELSLDMLGRVRDDLKDVQDALVRIENRSYGLCNDCGCAIPRVRLEAMPTAEFCIDCKSRMEAA